MQWDLTPCHHLSLPAQAKMQKHGLLHFLQGRHANCSCKGRRRCGKGELLPWHLWRERKRHACLFFLWHGGCFYGKERNVLEHYMRWCGHAAAGTRMPGMGGREDRRHSHHRRFLQPPAHCPACPLQCHAGKSVPRVMPSSHDHGCLKVEE